MKYLITTNTALVLVGCGEKQQSVTTQEAKTEPTTAKLSDIDIHEAAINGNIEIVKQHFAAGINVNEMDETSWTPLHFATTKEVAELLIFNGVDVNAKNIFGALFCILLLLTASRNIPEDSSQKARM